MTVTVLCIFTFLQIDHWTLYFYCKIVRLLLSYIKGYLTWLDLLRRLSVIMQWFGKKSVKQQKTHLFGSIFRPKNQRSRCHCYRCNSQKHTEDCQWDMWIYLMKHRSPLKIAQ